MFDSGIRLAKVVRSYPEGHSVDLVMYDDNSPVSNVQVLSGSASSRSGFSGLVAPTAPPDGEWGNRDSGDEDMIAAVAYMRGEPIVLGFLRPQVNQMTFKDENRITYRFPSDVYVTCDGKGNTELYHPSGTYLRIGSGKDHEDLSGKDYDGAWAINRNTDSAVDVRLGVSNAGTEVASLHFDPLGNVNFQCDKTLVEKIDEKWRVEVAETTLLQSGSTTTIRAPLIMLDGDVYCTKNFEAAMSIKAGTDIVAAGEVAMGNGLIALGKHKHVNVTPGTGVSGGAVGGGGSAGVPGGAGD